MKHYRYTIAIVLLIVAVVFTGCKQSMVISKVDYSQSIESVLEPNEEGVVEDLRHGLKFNIKPLQYAETQDTSSITTNQVRYIRGQEGFYYLTAPDYKHVYVMAPDEGKLKLKKKLKILDNGIEKPAFNQRLTHIQLLDRKTGDVWKLGAEGIEKEESQMAKSEVN